LRKNSDPYAPATQVKYYLFILSLLTMLQLPLNLVERPQFM